MLAAVVALLVISTVGGSVIAIRHFNAQKTPINREERALQFAQRLFHKESLAELTVDEAWQVERNGSFFSCDVFTLGANADAYLRERGSHGKKTR
jgi:hypothetical protein